MMIPDWFPTRHELQLRAIKWIWRGSRLLEEWSRRHLRNWAREGPQTQREWRRFARFLERMDLDDDRKGAS